MACKDPLLSLRNIVAREKGLSGQKRVNTQSIIQYLLEHVDWPKLLPLVVPLALQVLRGMKAAKAQPQAGPQPTPSLEGMGGLTRTAQPEGTGGDILSTLVSVLGGARASQVSTQPDALRSLLQSLGGTQAAQLGGLLGLLGTRPDAQRSMDANSLLEGLAASVDLDGDGIPDFLEAMLGGAIGNEAQRKGAASLLEQLLRKASPDALSAFAKGAAALLSAR